MLRKEVLIPLLILILSIPILDQAGRTSNDGSDGWKVANDIPLGEDYRATSTMRIEISTIGELQNIGTGGAYPQDGHYVLKDDIDAGGFSFRPIGTGPSNYFRGVLDGNGYTVTNIKIELPENEYVGLFSIIDNPGIVKNLNLSVIRIIGDTFVGTFAGINNGEINNCRVISDGYVKGNHTIGGIVGCNKGLIRNSSAVGPGVSEKFGIRADGTTAGGIAGNNGEGSGSYATIENCYADCVIDSEGSWVGGIAGYNSDMIRQCGFEGTFNLSDTWNGGIVGWNHGGTVLNSYWVGGELDGNNQNGGVVGHLDSGTIANCYASGMIIGDRGGIAGRNNGTISNCFWDTQRTNAQNPVIDGSAPANTHGKTTAEMKQRATYTTLHGSNWDFVNIWTVEEGMDYPRLRVAGNNLNPPLSIGFAATLDEYDGVHLSWSQVDYSPPGNMGSLEAVYRIYRSDTAEQDESVAAVSGWISSREYTDSTAVPGQDYFYWIKVAVNINGDRESQATGGVLGSRSSLPPVVTIIRTPDRDFHNSSYTVAVDVDRGTIEYSIDSGEWTTYSAPFEVSEEGLHTVDARATDTTNNTGTATQVGFTIDRTEPTLTTLEARDTDTQSDQITNKRTVSIAMSGIDNSGTITGWLINETSDMPTVEQMKEGSTDALLSYTIQSAGDGSKTLYGWIMDQADNINSLAQATILLDTTTSVAVDDGDRCILNNSTFLTGTKEKGAMVTVGCATASVGAVTYPGETAWAVNLTALDIGNNLVTTNVTDTAGNTDSDQVAVKYSVPVSANIDKESEELIADGSSTLQLTIGLSDEKSQPVCDGTPIEVTTDAGEISPSTHTTTNGHITCRLKASGKVETAHITVKYGNDTIGTSDIEMIPGPIDQLVFTDMTGAVIEGSIILDVDSASSFIQIQSRDAYDHPVAVQSDTMILLSSSADNAGAFSTMENGWSWIQGDASVTLTSGSNAVLLKYKATQEGQFTLTAAEFPSIDWTDGSQEVMIGGADVVAIIQGAPTGTTNSDTAEITIVGTDVIAYKYKLDSDSWSDEIDVSTVISLSGLSGGAHTLYVIGRNSIDKWQSFESASVATWTVNLIATVPDDPAGLSVDSETRDSIRVGWDPNADVNVIYNVYRSQTEKGIFHQINSESLDIYDMESGKIYFTDKNVRKGITYYYKVRAFLDQLPSAGFSSLVSAAPVDPFNFDFTIIKPNTIVNVGGKVNYYIQLFHRDKFEGTINLSCSGLTQGISYEFSLNGVAMGSSLSGVVPPASITLEVTAGSTVPVGEDQFSLSAQNVWQGGGSELWTETLSLMVVPRNEEGIHVEVGKLEARKGERVKLYGSILPPLEGKNITVTLTSQKDSSSQEKNIKTSEGGQFEDTDWISTLDVGTYDVSASWTDDSSDLHTSETRTFTVDKGQVVLTCLQESGETPSIEESLTILGGMEPSIAYAPINLMVFKVVDKEVDPTGLILAEEKTIYTTDSGHYSDQDTFFDQKGIWKFKAYWEGNDDYIGCESDFLVVPVGIDSGRAIILGGGEADISNTYWGVTKKLTIDVYRDFKAKGFNDDMITLMIHSQMIDTNHDEIEEDVVDIYPPTVDDFVDVIRTGFASELNADTPLFIYMQGHGTSDGRFRVLGSDQYISSSVIGSALDELQAQTDCTVILILESCYSGNFIEDLSGQNRVILTSAGDEPYNTDASGRIAFSRYLFSKLKEGNNLKKAFEYARSKLINMGYPSPQLDDNGDGIAQSDDGLLAFNTYLIGELTWGLKPEIAQIGLAQVIEEGSSAPITVEVVKGDVDVERVWVQVIPPYADIGGGDQTIAYPEIDLTYNESTGNYESILTDLTRPGLYKIIALAEDVDHEVSDPGTAYISAVGTILQGDVNGDGDVDLADAILALKVAIGLDTSGEDIALASDVNGDQDIGIAEAIYILQKMTGLRN